MSNRTVKEDAEQPPLPEADWRRAVRRQLLSWFQRHARDLPWRRTDDPYRVWISEVMLQQTQVATVIPYYERFVSRFPHPAALAEADEQEVLRLWEGLGYYRRARQLHAAAKQIVDAHDGQFPETFDEVLALPGVGRYTAGAVLSIARDARLPILEANSLRVFSRLLAYEDDVTRNSVQTHLWSFAELMLPQKNSGAFNQAIMELGSEICKPKEPLCDDCPIHQFCPTRANGWQDRIPAPKQKKKFEELREAAVVIWKEGEVLIRRCQEGERWAGLWDFPRFSIEQTRGDRLHQELVSKTVQLTGVQAAADSRLTTIKHGVTRFRITLQCYEARYVNEAVPALGEQRWLPPDQLQDVPLSTTGRKISNLLNNLSKERSE